MQSCEPHNPYSKLMPALPTNSTQSFFERFGEFELSSLFVSCRGTANATAHGMRANESEVLGIYQCQGCDQAVIAIPTPPPAQRIFVSYELEDDLRDWLSSNVLR